MTCSDRNCISSTQESDWREGRRAVYGYRHFLQALLVRRLLWERVPADQIAALVARRSIEETEKLLLGGVRYVAEAEVESPANPADRSGRSEAARPESWSRTRVVPGVELHLREDLPKLKPAERRRLIERLEEVLGRRGM